MGIIEKMRLDGKKIFVTGGARGIGKSVAKLYLENNAKVAICGSTKENALKTVNEFIELGFDKENIIALGIDFTNIESIKSSVNEVINKWNKIDILVNNAGITSNESLLDLTDDKLEQIYNVNVFGLIKMTREVVNHMKDTGGSIINTSSMVGINGGIHQLAYASSKSAVNGITISLAKELGIYNIRVNAVSPGVVNTDMMQNAVNEQMKERLSSLTPLKRMASVDELSGAYLYLASDKASFTTGTIIKVDGGLLM